MCLFRRIIVCIYILFCFAGILEYSVMLCNIWHCVICIHSCGFMYIITLSLSLPPTLPLTFSPSLLLSLPPFLSTSLPLGNRLSSCLMMLLKERKGRTLSLVKEFRYSAYVNVYICVQRYIVCTVCAFILMYVCITIRVYIHV